MLLLQRIARLLELLHLLLPWGRLSIPLGLRLFAVVLGVPGTSQRSGEKG
jgi:hypothetical protein